MAQPFRERAAMTMQTASPHSAITIRFQPQFGKDKLVGKDKLGGKRRDIKMRARQNAIGAMMAPIA